MSWLSSRCRKFPFDESRSQRVGFAAEFSVNEVCASQKVRSSAWRKIHNIDLKASSDEVGRPAWVSIWLGHLNLGRMLAEKK